jgi:hypothetical protein
VVTKSERVTGLVAMIVRSDNRAATLSAVSVTREGS